MLEKAIHIQFAPSESVHGGEHIRKWSREPFEGGEAYVPAAAHSELFSVLQQVWDAHDRFEVTLPGELLSSIYARLSTQKDGG